MEEAPIPIFNKTPDIPNESNILNFTLEFNKNIYQFHLIEIDNNKLKLFANNEINEENELCKYETILDLDILKTTNKYFKMFDNYDEFKKDFIDLCKSTKITNVNQNEIIIIIELVIKSDNLLNIILNKVEMNEKEKISYLLLDAKNKNTFIKNLNLEIKKMKNKISSLENIVNNLINKVNEIQIEKNSIKNLNNEEDNNIKDIEKNEKEKEKKLKEKQEKIKKRRVEKMEKIKEEKEKKKKMKEDKMKKIREKEEKINIMKEEKIKKEEKEIIKDKKEEKID